MKIKYVIFAVGFILTSLYWPDISSPASSPRWIFLGFVPVLLCLGRIKVTIAHAIGTLFVAWAIGLTYFSHLPLDSVGTSWKLLLFASCFCLGSMIEDVQPLILGCVAGLSISVGIAVFQLFGIDPVRRMAIEPPGLFVNSNFFGEASALILVAVAAERLWRFIPIPALGLLLSGARGATLAAGIGLAAVWISKAPRIAISAFALAGCVVLAISATRHNSFASFEERFELWREVGPAISFLGSGLGSYWSIAPHPIGIWSEHAHNDFIEFAFETGWVGFALLLCFLLAVIAGSERLRPITLTLIGLSCVGFPIHGPVTAALGLMCAGGAARDLRRFRLPFADRGGRLLDWLADIGPENVADLPQRSGRHVSL